MIFAITIVPRSREEIGFRFGKRIDGGKRRFVRIVDENACRFHNMPDVQAVNDAERDDLGDMAWQSPRRFIVGKQPQPNGVVSTVEHLSDGPAETMRCAVCKEKLQE